MTEQANEPTAQALINSAASALSRINSLDGVDDLYSLFGIAKDTPDPAPAWAALSQKERATYAGVIDRHVVEYAAQTEIGHPGTDVVDGRIRIEQNPRLQPAFARGRVSRPGVLEHLYRTEPVAFKSLNEITALVCGATYDIAFPDGVDDDTRAISERSDLALKNHREGMADTLAAMSTAFKLGFSVFEPVWQTKQDGFRCVYALPFREQSTVDRWLFDERQSVLVGADFEPKEGKRYTLTKGGTYATERLLLVNINAVGNNVEGVAPGRVATGLRKLKELLLQISGVSFQKYGVPIAQIVRELADASASQLQEIGGEASRAELRKTISRVQNMRATIAPVLDMPIGTKLQYTTPTNDMPDIRPILEYLDTMIALCFHNEGALLGSQSFGSYAMASVSDSKFMRAAPVYASRIARAFTEILHHTIRWNHPDPDSIEVWPVYTFRFAGTQDASKWADDMVKLANARVWTWPDEPRRMAAANMGLSVDAFDSWEKVASIVEPGAPPQPQVDGEAVDVQATALNGAQVTSMVEVVQAVASGALPRMSGVRILMRAFQMTEAEANQLMGDSGTDDFSPAGEAP